MFGPNDCGLAGITFDPLFPLFLQSMFLKPLSENCQIPKAFIEDCGKHFDSYRFGYTSKAKKIEKLFIGCFSQSLLLEFNSITYFVAGIHFNDV